jgi:NADPH:quinone reductase-like Zn-dependent oxidoreductase
MRSRGLRASPGEMMCLASRRAAATRSLLGLGADEYLDDTQQNVAEYVSDVDVAFDTVGGETTESLVSTVRARGASS